MPVPLSSIAPNLQSLQGIQTLQFPSDAPKYYVSLLLNTYNRPNPLTTATLVPQSNIILPLPNPLIDSHGIAYTEEALMPFLNAIVENIPGSNIVKNSLGIAPNQMMVILLKGPTYKRFEFTWRFSPRTGKEAKTLNTIIRVLNNGISPGLEPSGHTYS